MLAGASEGRIGQARPLLLAHQTLRVPLAVGEGEWIGGEEVFVERFKGTFVQQLSDSHRG
jgi:hypothetical protein